LAQSLSTFGSIIKNQFNLDTMKAKLIISLTVFTFTFILADAVNGQNVGVAADKQKQENLEKNKKRQAELKKKYNSLTPEQAAEAKKRADAYKKSGGKSVTTAEPAPSGKKPSTPATNKTSATPKQGNVQKPATSKAPVWMDANGKPKPVTPTAQPGKKEVKPTGIAPKPAVSKTVKETGKKYTSAEQVCDPPTSGNSTCSVLLNLSSFASQTCQDSV